MITRKSLFVVAAMILFVVSLSACMPGSPMAAPDVEISMDAAVAGQNEVMNGLSTGSVSLSEEQASSLITELLKQNGLNALEISAIHASMDGMMNNIEVELGQPVAGVDRLGVAGSLTSSGGVVSVDIDQAYAGGMGVTSEVLDFVASQINAQLATMPLGLPDGTYGLTPDLAIQLMGMMQAMGLNSAEIAAVKTSFEDGMVSIVAELGNAVAGVDSLGLTGAVSLDGGQLSVDLNEAFAGNLVADPTLVALVGDQINSALGGMMFPPISVDAEGGNLMVGMGQ